MKLPSSVSENISLGLQCSFLSCYCHLLLHLLQKCLRCVKTRHYLEFTFNVYFFTLSSCLISFLVLLSNIFSKFGANSYIPLYIVADSDEGCSVESEVWKISPENSKSGLIQDSLEKRKIQGSCLKETGSILPDFSLGHQLFTQSCSQKQWNQELTKDIEKGILLTLMMPSVAKREENMKIREMSSLENSLLCLFLFLS